MPGETWAEATYGTKLWHRHIQHEPDYPLEVAASPSTKLLEVYGWLADHDPSHLAWNSQDRLAACYQKYWEQLDRDVDFYRVWLPEAAQATNSMLGDPGCGPE